MNKLIRSLSLHESLWLDPDWYSYYSAASAVQYVQRTCPGRRFHVKVLAPYSGDWPHHYFILRTS